MSNMYKLDIIQIIMCSTNITGIGMWLLKIIIGACPSYPTSDHTLTCVQIGKIAKV